MRTGGDRFGRHRVLEPRGVLPQQAERLDPSLPLYDNELLVDVESLNIDSASFHQISAHCAGALPAIQSHIEELVRSRGKHHNRVTGSGGMLIGRVGGIGPRFRERNGSVRDIAIGDRIATLVSLTLTPLEIREIRRIRAETERVDVSGHAILFESGIYARLPSDISETVSLAVMDVCGAPAQTLAMCRPGETAVVLGGGGKSGLLSLAAAKRAVGERGRVIALDYSDAALTRLRALSFVDAAERCDARDAVTTHELVREMTNGAMADVVINVTNLPDTEMACVLAAKPGGWAYFFNMATSFSKAVLGAEGTGSHVELIMGNGFRPGHAECALQILRETPELGAIFEGLYGAA